MASSTSPEIESSALSHIGPVREDNQDAIRISDLRLAGERGLLFAIADGMGGYSHGALASSLALDTLFERFYHEPAKQVMKNLRRSIEAANLNIYQTAQSLGAGRMGTTLTAVHVFGSQLHLAHVGDSRAYLVRDHQVTCLTNDHTMVGNLVRMRVLTPDKVRMHEQRSILTKSLGLTLFVQPDLMQLKLLEDDRFVLCSDGVWSVVEDEEFAALAKDARSMEALVQALLALALERQTDDNISAVAIHIRRLIASPEKAKARRVWGWSYILRNLWFF